MNINLQIFLPRFVAIALFGSVMAGAWDIWWHSAIGRDNFFIPPHLLLYAAVGAAIMGGILYGFSSFFFQPEFQYSLNETTIAITASILGGIGGGILVSQLFKKFSWG